DHNLRVTLNNLVKVPCISERVKEFAKKLVGESTGTAKTYLENLINDVDTKAPELPLKYAVRLGLPPASRLNDPIGMNMNINLLVINYLYLFSDPQQVDFEIKNPFIARRFLGQPSKYLMSLDMVQ
ncbi:MAG: hypothetical protein EZS28_053086, partial [Streblomastix strix]